ncbi:hypothetical protein COA08_21315 [Bacillus cereus]|uniref:Uncharacterized protein n=1 Tax=Bacillus cereus TaxID=1396 RepID=A0A2B1CJP0_BACCE|nr:hypothetical protein CON06_04615 [Bacillus cereus]PFA09887.1 hypothetical protein CN382_21815 [Bacillus cereus]PFM28773.1 hypothetical protein COJ43_30430 [Bacillus cereus]PGL60535.1 hypothetical protein CN927_14665 [Bacillus cereus]PGQ06795.1 hypothetical protein COA08_21315 [Bacillus cereus]
MFLGNKLDFITFLQRLASPKEIAHIDTNTMQSIPFFERIIEPYTYSMTILYCFYIRFTYDDQRNKERAR